MTPSQLYARTPVHRSHDVGRLKGCYYNHVPELSDSDYLPFEDPSRRVELRFYKDFCFDSRRVWVLASVWLDDQPFMIIQNAGREGDDHAERFITDVSTYREAAKYLKSLCVVPEMPISNVVELDGDIASLTEFYGNCLNGHFEHYRY